MPSSGAAAVLLAGAVGLALAIGWFAYRAFAYDTGDPTVPANGQDLADMGVGVVSVPDPVQFETRLMAEQDRLRTLLAPEWLMVDLLEGDAPELLSRCPQCGALVYPDDVLLHTEWHIRSCQ